MSFGDLLRAEFEPYGSLSAEQVALLEKHYQLLVLWNQRLNLTRISDVLEVVRFHYCESLFVGSARTTAKVLPAGPLTVGDFGSGAGFPGIPLAVIRPDIQVVLLESDLRKTVFLREATRELSNVQVFAGRFEKYPGTFDWIVSRAVAPQEVLSSRLAPNFALLMSVRAAPEGAQVVALPWGRDRALIVSRGTSR